MTQTWKNIKKKLFNVLIMDNMIYFDLYLLISKNPENIFKKDIYFMKIGIKLEK